jgi:hypothetical protein
MLKIIFFTLFRQKEHTIEAVRSTQNILFRRQRTYPQLDTKRLRLADIFTSRTKELHPLGRHSLAFLVAAASYLYW